MLTEHDKNRLLTLTFRIARLYASSDREQQIKQVVEWVIDDWQREKRMLENEDRQ
jgi:hypothetical protein